MRACSLALALALVATPAAWAADGTLAPLPPQRLAKDACALFVWARSEARGPILMAEERPAQVRASIGGRLRILARVKSEAQPGRQTFAGHGLSLALDLDLAASRRLPGGEVVSDGMLTVTESDGTAAVIPVAGVAACQD